MIESHGQSRRPRGIASARTVAGIAAVVLIVTGVVLSVREPPGAVSAAQVVAQVRDAVLSGARDRDDPSAGMIGSAHYGAREFDPVTREFLDLRIETSRAIILAERGRLVVDVREDSVYIDLAGVRFVPLPPEGKEGEPEPFREVGHFRYGPIRWHEDIVPDGRGDPGVAPAAPDAGTNLAQGASIFDRAE